MTLLRGELVVPSGRREFSELAFGVHLTAVAAAAPRNEETQAVLLMPGGVDPHVHFREPGVTEKEGIVSGSHAALRGGVTTVLEMPNTVPPCGSPEALAEKRALYAQKAKVHWGLHYQATYPMAPLPGVEVASAKIYMAKSSVDPALTTPEALDAILQSYPRVAVHAEDETKFCAGIIPMASPGRDHHLRRPVEAITSALDKLERSLKRIVASRRPRLIICHVATREELAWVKRMKHEGFDVWAETCPHYVLLTQDDYVRIGNALKVNPPLRAEADREAVLAALESGEIDFLATDHAPHLPAEKAQTEGAPSGIAGIEVYLPLLATLAERGQISWQRLLALTSERPTACYGVPKRNGLVLGNFADIAVLERRPQKRSVVLTRAGWHPYIDFDLAYDVAQTFVGGHLAYERDNFSELAPQAKEVYT
jgi:dihydroorotase